MIRLAELVERGLGLEVFGDAETIVSGVRHDSRAVEPGDLFVAIPGRTADGRRFAGAALRAGAAALAVEEELEGVAGASQLRVADARAALAPLSAAVYGEPFDALSVVGITGTNGKTTTAWIVEQALTALGHSPALLGTVQSRGPGFVESAPFTTPEGDALARFARRAADAGGTHLVMEVSSHAMQMHRADAIKPHVAAFTNLSQDHLDFHGTMEAYFEAKARLFTELKPKRAVVHVDDAWGARLAERLSPDGLLRVSGRAGAEVELSVLESRHTRDGIRARLRYGAETAALSSPMIGSHNLENLLVATGILLALGVPLSEASRCVGAASGAPGRLERVEGLRDVMVLVDYAHTPDALARALSALRTLTPGRLGVVFGCGGDRDREKRPMMGEAAAAGADLVFLTSDNPRTEDPHAILAAIEPPVASSHARVDSPRENGEYAVIEDRAAAIRAAIAACRPGDTLLIAGKGHEDYQIRGTTRLAFDDRIEARDAISALGGH